MLPRIMPPSTEDGERCSRYAIRLGRSMHANALLRMHYSLEEILGSMQRRAMARLVLLGVVDYGSAIFQAAL